MSADVPRPQSREDVIALRSLLDMWLRQKSTAPRCLVILTRQWVRELDAWEGVRTAVAGDL